MTLTLRRATADDLMAVGALHQRSRAAAYSSFLPPAALTAPTPEAMGHYWTARWQYEQDTHLMTVAEGAGPPEGIVASAVPRLAGFTYVGPDDLADPASGLLCAIHLEPDERGRGVGQELMIDALATFRARGYTRAVLWVLRDNLPARRFYERGGWVPDGTERDEVIGGAPTRQLRYGRPL